MTETIHLTLMEAKLLRYLIENEGKAVSRKTILEEVWDLHEDTDTRAIDNFIVRLRKIWKSNRTDRKFCKPFAASAIVSVQSRKD